MEPSRKVAFQLQPTIWWPRHPGSHNPAVSRHLNTGTHLEGLLAGVSAGHEVVADPDEPVAVPVPVVEAVGGGDEDVGREDGGGAHEVRLA